VGRSVKDNSPLPPSVLVDELRDYLVALIGAAGLERITRMHPLQPFSPSYFSGQDQLFSYSPRLREAAQLAGQGREERKPLIAAPLPPWSEDAHRVGLQQLIDFYRNPARVFARQRLNLQLVSGAALLEEREPFALERYSGSELEAELVRARQAGRDAETCFQLLDARGILPHGKPGRRLFERLFQVAGGMAQRLQALGLDTPLPLRDFAVRCGDVTLEGRLQELYPQGQFAFSVTQFFPHQLLELWLRHLVLCMLRPADVALQACWLEADGEGSLRSVEEPERWLGQLLDLYRQGLDEPLHFYPGTSWVYAENYLRRGDPQAALHAAASKWQGNAWYAGDQAKPYQQLLFADGVMLDERFASISLAVFRPLIEHLETS
jgi:exodeoxyribonuclease V gamma subunit